jgi:hypothetical protein
VLERWEDALERFLGYAVFAAKDVITPEMVADAILKKGKRFGPLKIDEMEFEKETLEEFIDALAYVSGSLLRDG